MIRCGVHAVGAHEARLVTSGVRGVFLELATRERAENGRGNIGKGEATLALDSMNGSLTIRARS
mgnify:CR=1 FL=1